MMSKNEFSKVLAEAVKVRLEQMGTHVEIESREVLKNNGNVQNGLGISDGSNIQSVFYIDAMYERFVAGEGDLDQMAASVSENYLSNKPTDDFNLGRIMDYEQAKDHIVVSVRNAEKNEELLKTVPHDRVGDLAVMYRVEVTDCPGGGTGSVLINDGLMRSYGIDQDTLREQAWNNTREQHPYSFLPMIEALKKMLPGVEEDFPVDLCPELDGRMYLLTNSGKDGGASYLCDKQTLAEVAKELDDNLIILPSSIHECIVLPESKGGELAMFKAMVEEVNATQVTPEEFLSNNVYCFDAQTQELSVYDGQSEAMNQVCLQ